MGSIVIQCSLMTLNPHNSSDFPGVLITAGTTPNTLGVVRCFGRRGIPVYYLDSEPRSMVRHSKYITRRLKCPGIKQSETAYIDALVKHGSQSREKLMLISTGDLETLVISRYRQELEPFYLLSVPSAEIVSRLVNKREFSQLLSTLKIPCPKTCLPRDLDELQSIGQEIGYPFVIKPVYSAQFQDEFKCKCILVDSREALQHTLDRLKGRNLEVIIQEMVPGEDLYSLYTYFDKYSNPVAICGYDKLRQFPLDFGSGSLCKTTWRELPINLAIQTLRSVNYYGTAEVEFIRDPRDGEYKMLEINTRTTHQNRLPPACGIDIDYISYLDATGQLTTAALNPEDDVFWIDDFFDVISCLIRLKRKKLKLKDLFISSGHHRVHSIAAWDDPDPAIIQTFILGISAWHLLLKSKETKHWLN